VSTLTRDMRNFTIGVSYHKLDDAYVLNCEYSRFVVNAIIIAGYSLTQFHSL